MAKINAIEAYMLPRQPGDPDLVNILYNDIRDIVGETEANIFLNHTDVQEVKDLNPGTQRYMLNKVLNNYLCVLRAYVAIDVSTYLVRIINDGTIEHWRMFLRVEVLPFFKQNNVFSLRVEG